MEQKPRWNWVITLAAVFLAFCLGFGVARWTQHTDGVTVRTARTVPAQTESALPSVPAASAPTEKPTAAPTEAATRRSRGIGCGLRGGRLCGIGRCVRRLREGREHQALQQGQQDQPGQKSFFHILLQKRRGGIAAGRNCVI